MKKTAVFIAAGTGMGADAAKHLSSKVLILQLCLHLEKVKN